LRLEFTKMNVDNMNPELLEYSYIINRTSSNTSAVYADVKFSEEVLNFTGTFSLRLKYTEKYINYITLNLDYCKALQLLYKDFITKIVVDGLRAVSNYPLDCPLIKVCLLLIICIYYNYFLQNKLYYFNGFTFNTKQLPSYFPEISFALNAKLNANLRPLSEVTIYGELRKK
ncbi:hypothetical protein KR215_003650, partial [Drosophila sulfurigaster]